MDGVVGVTQKAIPAGGEFTYKFEISKAQSGTFWWIF
jgi:FtsP/CotA-like multicopper oxidase with cupredoxin domain